MEILTNKELCETSGGGKLTFLGIAAIIGGVVTFIIGAVNGYQRPYPCNYTGK